MGAAVWLAAASAFGQTAASIVPGTDGATWRIAAGGAVLTLRCGGSADFAVLQLTSPSGRSIVTTAAADTALTVAGKALAFGRAADGFAYEKAAVVADGTRQRLDIVYSLEPSGLRVTRHYAVVDGTPTFEAWTTIERTKRNSIKVADLNAVTLTIPAGRLWWVSGLQGDNTSADHENAFTLQNRTLTPGEQFAKGSQMRSSDTVVPWFAVDESPDEFYAALLWSGAWSFTAARSDTALSVTFGLASMSTTVGDAGVEGPHVVFGALRGGMKAVSAALRTYVSSGLRQNRTLPRLVTANTWYSDGTYVDEDRVRGAMVRAAGVGAELFVLDAGWYGGAGTTGRWDFETGLGVWQPDAARFPNGLAPLSDFAHSLGMKFGLWVEPDRANLNNVQNVAGGDGLVQEPWLATHQGAYGSDTTARICLSGPGRQWVIAQLTQLVSSARPDYIKWDNNLWINCDRSGHGHGTQDGNFADTNGFYTVLASLRAQFPDLLIESSGGGGSRLDLGMLRYSDAAWVDDRTAPSAHVRHNVEGLSAVFPPAYLLTFVVDGGDEPLHQADDLSLLFRSRAIGALGMSFVNMDFTDDELATMTQETGLAKSMRDAGGGKSATMLTAQMKVAGGPGWDAIEETSADGQQVVVWAFQSDAGADTFTVKPTGLAGAVSYEVWSADLGRLGAETGASLMANGIELDASPVSAAHVLVLIRQ